MALLFLRDERGSAPNVGPQPTDDAATHEERVLRCRACGHALTKAAARIEVDGAHAHEFVNPSAIVYRIGCFREAGGCASAGDPSSFFSWFAGYSWQLALCAGCGVHVGWRFQKHERSFFGLILERLAE